MTRIPAWLSGVALAVVTALGSGYLVLGVLDLEPMAARDHVTVRMDHAAGLRPGSAVVYRGVDIGTVDEVRSVPGGVRLRLSYDRARPIPVNSVMKIENLSALGEPVFAFLPGEPGRAGYLRDGDELAGSVDTPATVPELLAASARLLDQADAAAISRLVDTFAAAVEHAPQVAPAIERAAGLLAVTLARHEPSLETVLRNLLRLMPDADWVRPALTAAPPQLDRFGATLGVSYQYLFEGSALLRGREVLGSWREEEQQFVDFLSRLAPELGALGVALRPVSSAAGPALGAVDMATLLDRALSALPGDRLRITLRTAQADEGER
ncbi:MlaD family protein [Nocardia implantans]|uniref:MlaD family protein n=1 Tax=Nocardia implantans TaxID=3108168 RepID=A0ABU6AXC5_9NOCA|nr:MULTISPECIES: MlaD family protein [unclassified Nocardia]MBF6193704.1 MCE family protein [Nocardia beijingensis]MEA3529558.1 MlaD family protein [Nocardia sp. CDC192]MEB3512144.1 MlaD family protein [Nocardia sp. CDC186]